MAFDRLAQCRRCQLRPSSLTAAATWARCASVRPWIGSGRHRLEARPRCSAIAATTRMLPPNSENSPHSGSSRSDSARALAESPACAARVIANAGPGRVPPITEYQASQPAFNPVAAKASPETPIVTCSGTTERSAASAGAREGSLRSVAGSAVVSVVGVGRTSVAEVIRDASVLAIQRGVIRCRVN